MCEEFVDNTTFDGYLNLKKGTSSQHKTEVQS